MNIPTLYNYNTQKLYENSTNLSSLHVTWTKKKKSLFSFSLSLCFSLSLHTRTHLSSRSPLFCVSCPRWNSHQNGRMALCFASAFHKVEWPQFSFFSPFSVSACPTSLSHCPAKACWLWKLEEASSFNELWPKHVGWTHTVLAPNKRSRGGDFYIEWIKFCDL